RRATSACSARSCTPSRCSCWPTTPRWHAAPTWTSRATSPRASRSSSPARAPGAGGGHGLRRAFARRDHARAMQPRKIIHVDMDAFYASVEQRDDPSLRGRPGGVAWRGARSVVCAASYAARKYGIRSGMPALRAERLWPHAVFVPPDFPRYRAVSGQGREIFRDYTDLVEPLSLDEAYLDVSEPKRDLPSATAIA